VSTPLKAELRAALALLNAPLTPLRSSLCCVGGVSRSGGGGGGHAFGGGGIEQICILVAYERATFEVRGGGRRQLTINFINYRGLLLIIGDFGLVLWVTVLNY
jgi:hypothetical protein